MFHLSQTEAFQAKCYALRILTANTLSVLKDRTSTDSAKMEAVLSMMALDWTPALVRAVGFKLLNDVLKYVRQDVLDGPTYRLFADMIVHASDEQIPLEHTQWRIWRQLLIRFHLFEVTDIKAWVALIARFDSRGIRSPLCLQRIPYTELMAADWELPHPVMLIWIWQATRRDSSPCHISRPHAEFTPPDDSQALIATIRTDSVEGADIGLEYANLGREFGLAPNFEALSMANKLLILHKRKIEPTRILKFWGMGARRNALRAFAGSLRPAASGMQSYLNLCTFGLLAPDYGVFTGRSILAKIRII